MKKKKIKLKRMSLFEKVLIGLLAVLAVITVYPFYNVLIVSFSNVKSTSSHVPYLLPWALDLTGYKTILEDAIFFKSLYNSLFVTIAGTSINMFLSVMGAYVLSKRKLVGRRILLFIVLLPMLFNGGLIPTYLVIKSYNLIDNIWAMIWPCAVSSYYMLIMRNYFMSLPDSLEEAARIDGANQFQILVKIMLPISMPFMATFFLFYSVERWNEWWNAFLYISTNSLYPLQIYLRELLVNMNNQLSTQAQLAMGGTKVYLQSVQMATIIITAVPIICVYPFVQKHFVKGVMVGAVKE